MIPFADAQKSSRFPIITFLLILANVIVFVLELIAPDFESFINTYSFIPAFFHANNISTWIPLFTAAFLHAGFSHIGFNMLFLWVFGNNVEDSLGSFGYLLFYFGSLLCAALLQYAVDPHSTIPMLGASGAIAGVLGYYIVTFPRNRIKTLVLVWGGIFVQQLPAQLFLGYWAIVQLFSGVGALLEQQQGGTAWFAHVGGFIFGVLIAFLMKTRMPQLSSAESGRDVYDVT